MTTTAHDDQEFAELLAAAVEEATHRPDAEQSGTNAMNAAMRAGRAPRVALWGTLPEDVPAPTEGWGSVDGGARGSSNYTPDPNEELRREAAWQLHGKKSNR